MTFFPTKDFLATVGYRIYGRRLHTHIEVSIVLPRWTLLHLDVITRMMTNNTWGKCIVAPTTWYMPSPRRSGGSSASTARYRQQRRLPSSWELSKKGTIMREDERKGDFELRRGRMEAETNRSLCSNPINT